MARLIWQRLTWLRPIGPWLLCLLAACAAPTPREAAHRPEAVLAGFREASPEVTDLLERAAAWAVFPAVEEQLPGCAHEGVLLQRSGPGRPALLRCLEAPPTPGGRAYHLLVILLEPRDLEHLARGPLDLADCAHLSPHDGPPPRPTTPVEGSAEPTRWVVTTRDAELLFDPRPTRQLLELAPSRP